eukprot:TRINITY_DN4737_c0_g1_i6.p1 TRINITY_DN4737_c0_g1~~TRINITY_DN4737_c0_g1_i6.p1  ORF type:complete len:831 (+),score=273.99 TRINITY_DN4737_c0_g1_i6:76-2568(+)
MSGLEDELKQLHLEQQDNAEQAETPAEATPPPSARKPHPATDTTEMKMQRDNVLREVVTTEQTFVNDLRCLLHEYLTPIQAEKMLPSKQRPALDGALQALNSVLMLHSRFLQDAHLKYMTDSTYDGVIDALFTYLPFMKCYFPYVQNYSNLNLHLNNEENTDLLNWLCDTCERLGHQSVSQLLITPIQRIPRYVLLLETAYKHTPTELPLFERLSTVLAAVREVAQKVDECFKQSDNAAVLFDLQNKVKKCPADFRVLLPSRFLLRQGLATEMSEPLPEYDMPPAAHPNKHSVRFFLFNDILLLTDYQYHFSRYFETENMDVEGQLQQRLLIRNSISSDQSFYFNLATSAERKIWLDLMSSTIAEATKRKNDLLLNRGQRRRMSAVVGLSVNPPTRGRPGAASIDEEMGASMPSVSPRPRSASAARPQRSSIDISNAIAAAASKEGAANALGAMAKDPGIMPRAKSMLEKVNLFLRIRPFVTPDEIEANTYCTRVESEDMITLFQDEKGKPPERVCVYDQVFGPDAAQSDVFDRIGQELLGALFGGFNAACLAYGNTGAGKTFTMFGDFMDEKNEDRLGLVPRLLKNVFEGLYNPEVYESAHVTASFIQVYNNKVMDLMSPEMKTLKVKSSEKKQVKVEGMIEVKVNNYEEAMRLLQDGSRRRSVRAHRMNDTSSRSHGIFIISLHTKKHQQQPAKVSLYTIDLAGSENVLDTGVTGDGLLETRFIHQSLTTLGRCINILSENKKLAKKQPVPFRESELTHLLSDVLSGDFVCSLILNVSPSPVMNQAQLTAKTLAFGESVRKLDLNAKKVEAKNDFKDWLIGVWKSVSR